MLNIVFCVDVLIDKEVNVEVNRNIVLKSFVSFLSVQVQKLEGDMAFPLLKM